jgi:hypothetical protein
MIQAAMSLPFSRLIYLRFTSIWLALHLHAIQGSSRIYTANGWDLQTLMFIDMQILTSAFVPLTPWFEEFAMVKANNPGALSLSGSAMRNHLFFCHCARKCEPMCRTEESWNYSRFP